MKKKSKKDSALRQGIIYGLAPHVGCIGFIVASVLGATVAIELFKPLLMNHWFFHFLLGLSVVFATVSSVIYLKKNGLLSWKGAKRKKKYLVGMYGSTLGINVLLFFVIFPMTANLDTGVFANPTENLVPANASLGNAGLSLLTLQVDIPCPGHAPLISEELKKVEGVTGVKFGSPNNFEVAFDSKKTSKEKILALEVFNTYKAKVVSESIAIGAK